MGKQICEKESQVTWGVFVCVCVRDKKIQQVVYTAMVINSKKTSLKHGYKCEKM